MSKYLTEREITNAGNVTDDQLKGVFQTSYGVLTKMRSQMQWVHSHVTADKYECVDEAPNADMIHPC